MRKNFEQSFVVSDYVIANVHGLWQGSMKKDRKSADVKFADYIFADNKLKITDFKVLANEVSDHLPLFLEFN